MKIWSTIGWALLLMWQVTMADRNPDREPGNIDQFWLKAYPVKAAAEDSVDLLIYLDVPFFTLQFVKQDTGFHSEFVASLALKDDEGYQVGMETWQRGIDASEYIQTMSKTRSIIFFTSFRIPYGKYKVVGEIIDQDTHRNGIKKLDLDLSSYGNTPFLFPLFMLDTLRGSWGLGRDTIPNFRNEIEYIVKGVDIFVSGLVKPGEYKLLLDLKDEKGVSIWTRENAYTTKSPYLRRVLHLPLTAVSGLRAYLQVRLIQGNKKHAQELELVLRKPGVSVHIYNLESALSQMRYILTDEERKRLHKASRKERETLFYEFWKERDPTPNTTINELMDQYYLRVKYANEHFTTFQPGWETDMGMIYILFGAPDEIERSFISTNRNAYQTWYYYRINRSFTFLDENGFGDYRLITPYYKGRTW